MVSKDIFTKANCLELLQKYFRTAEVVLHRRAVSGLA
jgi:hypothetical protein